MELLAGLFDLGFLLHEDSVVVVLMLTHVLIAFADELLQFFFSLIHGRRVIRGTEQLVKQCHNVTSHHNFV